MPAAGSITPSSDAGTRGGLTIAGKVVDRIAVHRSSRVTGVVESGSTLDGLVGRRLPRASSEVLGNTARVSVSVAVAWPLDLAEVAATVRDEVGRTVTELTGMRAVTVDVVVAGVEYESQAGRRVQ